MITPPLEFWDVFKNTEGALSCAESLAIMQIASQAPEGLFAEYGTYRGKSAMSALVGLANGVFYLYDIEFNKSINIQEVRNTLDRIPNFINHLWLSPESSLKSIKEFNDYSYVFIDSGLHDDMVMEEVKLLEDRMKKDGIIAFHDYRNQFCAVERAYKYLLSTGKYEGIKIDWEPIFAYVKERNLEDGNNSWHQYPDLPHPPNFVGAVKRI